MPSTYKTLSRLILGEKLKEEETVGSFHNPVTKAKKKVDVRSLSSTHKWEQLWFLKENEDAVYALAETLAQEFFRLVIPNQPKTRVVKNDITCLRRTGLNRKRFVLSQGVPGYRPIDNMNDDAFHHAIRCQLITGLGEVLIMAMMTGENDLRLANLCLNYCNQIIKIDGDHAYEAIWHGGITADDFKTLPFIKDYPTQRWLCLLPLEYVRHANDQCYLELSQHEGLRREINRATLKVLLLPIPLIRQFINCYARSKRTRTAYLTMWEQNKLSLRNAAWQDERFVRYVREARQEMMVYINYLESFKTMRKYYLSMREYKTMMLDQLTAMEQQATSKLQATPAAGNP